MARGGLLWHAVTLVGENKIYFVLRWHAKIESAFFLRLTKIESLIFLEVGENRICVFFEVDGNRIFDFF